jgi:hypothetical protein
MSENRSRDTYRNTHRGFAVPLGRSGTRRRLLDSLRPEGALIPLDLELIEIVAELDPGMVDWDLHVEEAQHIGLR